MNHARRSFSAPHTRRSLVLGLFVLSVLLVEFVPFTVRAQDGQVIRLAFAPDSMTLASGGGNRIRNPFRDSSVSLWDVAAMRLRASFGVPGAVGDVAFSRDGKLIAVSFDRSDDAKESGQIMLFDTVTGHQRRTIESGEGVGHICFTPTPNLLAAMIRKGKSDSVDIKNIETGMTVRSLDTGSLRCMIITRDGNLCTSAGATVELWNLRNGEKLSTVTDGSVTPCLTYWSGGDLIAQGTVRFTDVPVAGEINLIQGMNGRLQRTIKMSRGVSALAFSPDGMTIAVGTFLWDVDDFLHPKGQLGLLDLTGAVLRELEISDKPISALVFSPDGRFLAGSSESGIIKLWETRSWKNVNLQNLQD